MQQTVCSSLPLVEFPLDLLARFSKIDDVTHLVPFVPAIPISKHLASARNMPLA